VFFAFLRGKKINKPARWRASRSTQVLIATRGAAVPASRTIKRIPARGDARPTGLGRAATQPCRGFTPRLRCGRLLGVLGRRAHGLAGAETFGG
jgi:hypothetical protein